MDKKDIAEEWFKIAAKDFAAAEYLQNMHPIPFDIICYHCQQSVEKYLKGYLALRGEEIKKTHDLTRLNKSCQEYDKAFKQIEDDCLMLTDYAVNIRYPFPLEINENDMGVALQGAERIKKFVLSKAKSM
jgi:HEPN domain-containing protein